MAGGAAVSAAGLSARDRHLYQFLTRHVQEEQSLLETYSQLAEETESEALRYVVRMLIEDERRHHAIFVQLAASLKADIELTGTPPLVPRLDFHKENRDEMVKARERLLERERADLRELRHLRQVLADVRDTTLWSLLVQIMERDTEKHIAMLRFAQDHSRR